MGHTLPISRVLNFNAFCVSSDLRPTQAEKIEPRQYSRIKRISRKRWIRRMWSLAKKNRQENLFYWVRLWVEKRKIPPLQFVTKGISTHTGVENLYYLYYTGNSKLQNKLKVILDW